MTDHHRDAHMKPQRRKSFQAKRAASEIRFKYLGLGAVLVACGFLVVLLSTIVGKAIPAFTYHYLNIPVEFEAGVSVEDRQDIDFNLVYKKGINNLLPFMSGRKNKRIARNLVSNGAGIELRRQVLANPAMIKDTNNAWLPLDDFADLYLKGLIAQSIVQASKSDINISREGNKIILTGTGDNGAQMMAFDQPLIEFKNDLGAEEEKIIRKIERKKAEQSNRQLNASPGDGHADIISRLANEIDALLVSLDALKQRRQNIDLDETLNTKTPSILVLINDGIVKIDELSRNVARGKMLIPLSPAENAASKDIRILYISTPQKSRKFNDIQVALIENMKSRGLIAKRLNRIFFTHGASREPEQAGIWGALVGSFFTMVITLALAFPLGMSTAIYLEEFAPRNRWTYLIEVNINNLAAVPSIIFGLLGLAVFLNWFDLPRSAPIVGGLVLALMTLPTIIIASRAAIKAVPPSIREAAYGIGASKVQAVFHHVLPLAMPGMFTGTIIGMAQALGETAPLLMIGMVAFIVDIPATLSDPATVMPVQIYMWADFPEPAFQQKTAAAILVLLTFLVAMNAVAVLLRRRFERRW